MRILLVVAALSLLAAKPGPRTVVNHASILAEPHFWSRHLGTVERGDSVAVLEEAGDWIKVKSRSSGEVGYVPRSTFLVVAAQGWKDLGVDVKGSGVAQAANASRGFAHASKSGDPNVKRLATADGWIGSYDDGPGAAKLQAHLSSGMDAFLADGHLTAPEGK